MKKYLVLFLVAAVITGSIFQALLDYPHPHTHELSGFVYQQQPDSITCGPTSAAMVLTWYGQPRTCQDVSSYTKTKWFEYDGQEIGLTLPDYVVAALNHLGVPASLRRGNVEQLKHFVSQQRPPIILVRTSDICLHYMVAMGYDDHYIYCADPAMGQRRAIPVKIFLSAWQLQTDLDGNDSGYTCPLCQGEGSYGWLHISCDLCGGQKRLDPMKTLFKEVGVQPYMMIVPNFRRE